MASKSPLEVTWTKEENKAFEDAIAKHFNNGSDDEWVAIASVVSTKTVEQVKHHYKLLVEDVNDIEAGLIPIPDYTETAPVYIEKEEDFPDDDEEDFPINEDEDSSEYVDEDSSEYMDEDSSEYEDENSSQHSAVSYESPTKDANGKKTP